MRKIVVIALILFITLIGIFSIFFFEQKKSPPSIQQNEYDSIKNDNLTSGLEKLRSLPYLSWSKAKVNDRLKGVIKYDHNKSFPGYNLYTDDKENAYLINMEGEIKHRWKFPNIKGRWEYAELLNNGEILAICVGKCLVKLDRHSRIIWIKFITANHDIEVSPQGTVLVPVWKNFLYNSRLVNFDSIFFLSTSGELLDEWSSFESFDELKELHHTLSLDIASETKKVRNILLELYFSIRNMFFRSEKYFHVGNYSVKGLWSFFKKSHFSFKAKIEILKEYDLINLIDTSIVKFISGNTYDYYHLNTIEILPDTVLGKKDKRFRKGNYLICLRNSDLIIILDKESKEVVWSWGPGILDWPHMPTMLKNGNILIFDNGIHRKYSRIVEINPLDKRIVWEYKANPLKNFFSPYQGSNQRLPNGNTLICESGKGRVFEVDNQGNIVWEFLNPEIKNRKRKLIYRMMRIPRNKVESWLWKEFKSGK